LDYVYADYIIDFQRRHQEGYPRGNSSSHVLSGGEDNRSRVEGCEDNIAFINFE